MQSTMILRAAAIVAIVGTTSCMMNGASRTAQGQLYVTGRPQYDAYFHDVHGAQVEAASWGEDKKGSHKSLVTALDLTPDAPDVTLVQAAHERAAKYAPPAGMLRLELSATDAPVAGGTGHAAS